MSHIELPVDASDLIWLLTKVRNAVQEIGYTDLVGEINNMIDAFAELGDATPILVGKHYLEHFGAGFGPRVLFVPEAGAGRIEKPINIGNAASVVHS